MTWIKNNPTVSVIMPTYNRAHMIGRAIQSILNQTYQDYEIIVVDDCSTDDTEAIVKSFNDERLRYIRLSENTGSSVVPRNTALKEAKGKYMAFLDSDDEWLPEKLEKQVNKFKSVPNDVGLIHGGYVAILEPTGKAVFKFMPSERGDVFQSAVEERIGLSDVTPLVKKECFQKVGLFDTELTSCQVWDMWIRVLKDYKMDFVPEVLAKYYIHDVQNTSSVDRRIQGLDTITRRYQSYLPKTIVSKRLAYLGNLCSYKGDFKKARRYFGESITNNPRDIYNYIRFLLCIFTPRIYQSRIKRHVADTARKRDGIIHWG